MKNDLIGIGAILSSTVCGVSMYLVWTSKAIQSMITVLAETFPILITLILLAIAAALVFAIAKGVIHLYGHALHIRDIYPDSGGAFPLVQADRDYIDLMPESVRLVEALTAGHIAGNKKPNATAIREAVTASRTPMLEMDALPALPETNGIMPFDITSVDPRNAPHWLLIGDTGSGKTTAAFSAMRQMRDVYGAEFTICEPYGSNWHGQADHITDDDIAQAITVQYERMEERLGLLREHEVLHAADLPNPPPYHVLLLEEADGVFDEMLRERRYKDVLRQLRQLARMGRKASLPLVTLSQTALTDVFNTHVRANMNNVLLFRNTQQVAENWRVSKEVKLPMLQPGTAYSIRMARQLQFSDVPRPDLKNGGINGVKPVIPTPYRLHTDPIPHQNPLPTDPHTAISQAVVKRIYDIYRTAGKRKIKTTQRLIFPDQETGGHWWYWIDAIVREVEGKPQRANSPIHLNIMEEPAK